MANGRFSIGKILGSIAVILITVFMIIYAFSIGMYIKSAGKLDDRRFFNEQSFSICLPENWTEIYVPSLKKNTYYGPGKKNAKFPYSTLSQPVMLFDTNDYFEGSISEFADDYISILINNIDEEIEIKKINHIEFLNDNTDKGIKTTITYVHKGLGENGKIKAKMKMILYFFKNENVIIRIECVYSNYSKIKFDKIFDKSVKTIIYN